MHARSAHHATFVIERTYDASPARVFAAWAHPEFKGRWFNGPDAWEKAPLELDFRVGGRERVSGGPPGGPVHAYEAHYRDIVIDQRIVYTYEMHMDAARISVSVATVEFEPAGGGTRLTLTEQGVYLDGGGDAVEREEGTRALLDKLAAELRRNPAMA